MLILKRRKNEEVYIGDEIRVRVVHVGRRRVRLGVEAPADVRIEREELRGRASSASAPAASQPGVPQPDAESGV